LSEDIGLSSSQTCVFSGEESESIDLEFDCVNCVCSHSDAWSSSGRGGINDIKETEFEFGGSSGYEISVGDLDLIEDGIVATGVCSVIVVVDNLVTDGSVLDESIDGNKSGSGGVIINRLDDVLLLALSGNSEVTLLAESSGMAVR